jgi:ribosomal protein L17
MRANRRRQRKHDLLAHPEAVRSIFDSLRNLLPGVIPQSEKYLIKMLNAVRNVERRPTSDTKRGRPSRWKRSDLIQVASHLRFLLDRETQGRVSLNSFISLYIRILNFPPDVIEALEADKINLFEATQLSRLTAERLNVTPSKAKELRGEIIRAHTMAQGSEANLRARVIDQLREKTAQPVNKESGNLGLDVVDELIELDPYDTRHLFWEELRRIALALRQVTPEDIDDHILEDFLSASDQLSAVLARVERRRLLAAR